MPPLISARISRTISTSDGASSYILPEMMDKNGQQVVDHLDLLLITVSLVTSVFLSSIKSTRARVQNNTGRPHFLTLVFSLALAAFSLFMSVLCLALGWAGMISIDVLTAVVFALLPALLSHPVEIVQYALLSLLTRQYKSLSHDYSSFRYATIGDPCNGRWNISTRTSKCPGKECNARLHIRFLPPTTIFPVSAISSIYRSRGLKSRRGEVFQDMLVFKHSANCIVGMLFDCQSRSRWWKSLSAATWLLTMKPSRINLDTSDQVIQTLALLYDILSIGKLVLKLRQPALEKYLRNDKEKKPRRAYRSICNSVLEETGLRDWGPVPDNITEPSYVFPHATAKWYGILFVVIAMNGRLFTSRALEENSHGDLQEVFREPERTSHIMSACVKWFIEQSNMRFKQRISAQSVLHRLENTNESDDFNGLIGQEVDNWLISWGFKSLSIEAV